MNALVSLILFLQALYLSYKVYLSDYRVKVKVMIIIEKILFGIHLSAPLYVRKFAVPRNGNRLFQVRAQ